MAILATTPDWKKQERKKCGCSHLVVESKQAHKQSSHQKFNLLMRTHSTVHLLLLASAGLPWCSVALDSPKSFLPQVEHEAIRSKLQAHRFSLAQQCPLCSVLEDSNKNKDDDGDDEGRLGPVRGFFSSVANMARNGSLRTIWDYFVTIAATVIRTPENVHPVRCFLSMQTTDVSCGI